MDAVGYLSAMRQLRDLRRVHLHDLEVLALIRAGEGDLVRPRREEEVRQLTVACGLGGSGEQRNQSIRGVSSLLTELAKRRLLRRLTDVDDACGEFQAELLQPVTVLPDEHHFALRRERKCRSPTRCGDQVILLDLVAIGQRNVLFVDREPVARQEDFGLQDVPRSMHDGSIPRVSVRRKAPARCLGPIAPAWDSGWQSVVVRLLPVLEDSESVPLSAPGFLPLARRFASRKDRLPFRAPAWRGAVPMKLIKVAAAALNQTPLDWDGNLANVISAISAAKAAQVGVLCLPELCLSGYGCEDAFLAPSVHRTSIELLSEVAPHTRGIVVSVGLPISHSKGIYNACALFADGEVAGLVAKRALAGSGIHYEPRWFRPWPEGERATISVAGRDVPVGDFYFDCGGIKIGFEICEDAWIARRPGAGLALDGVDVILNPSASHFAFGKHEVRQRLVLEGSRAFCVTYVYANLLGNEAGRTLYDGDTLIATAGELVASGRRFGFSDMELTAAVVDLELAQVRGSWASCTPRVSHPREAYVTVSFAPPPAELAPTRLERPEWEGSSRKKEEEFGRAVALGLFDYMRKSRSRGFVVSLSGGADSSAVACLVGLMVRWAEAELGASGLRKRLPFLAALPDGAGTDAIMGAMLTTVYQSTRNSSTVTRNAAAAVARAVSSRHIEVSVEELVGRYTMLAEEALERTLSWATDDVALQNIQARVRAPLVWMLANVSGALLLATSNRSEAAVGYATMDGDTAGGLSPIAGIDKAFLRQWLSWLERQGPADLGPIPELCSVTDQVPTAELRPPEESQTDEKDLMPYVVLDAIERAAIHEKRSPADVLRLLRIEFPEHDESTRVMWVSRFFRLFSRNQWKRERYAPSFHVDDASLDPKSWCRFPILSGGYERELRLLGESTLRAERPK